MTILNGTSASIRRGAITTVIGPNGAGKSTMFKTVFGLLGVRSGKIAFDGRDTTNFSPRQMLDAGMCYVPQGRNIFPELSVRHNLELGGVALADQSRLAGRVDAMMQRFPILREKANAQASTLSGGQQKLLEVARGLLLDPKLMLIDEPSIGLSPLLVQEVFAILKDLRAKGVTILLIEQNAKQALQISDYGLVLEQGQTRIEDTAAEHPGRSAHRPAVPRRRLARRRRKPDEWAQKPGRPDRRQYHELAVAGAARGCLRGRRHPRPLPPDGPRPPARPPARAPARPPSRPPASTASTSPSPARRPSCRCSTRSRPMPSRSARSTP